MAQYMFEIGFGLRPNRLLLFWALKGACCTLSFQTHPLSLTLQVSLDVGTWSRRGFRVATVIAFGLLK